MTSITLTLELPEDLAQEANEFGLLRSEILVGLLRTEVDNRVMEFVNAEIQAYRSEKAQKPKSPTQQK